MERALALNPKESGAYAARGYINAFFDLATAELDYRKALSLNPSNAEAYEGLAAVLYENPARREEVLQLIDQARKLDPLEPRLDVAKATFLFYGRSEVGEAETLLIEALRKDPLYQPALLRLAQLYGKVGRLAEAIKLSEQVLAADPSATQPRVVLQGLYLDIEDLPAAEDITRTAPEPSPTLNSIVALGRHDLQAAGAEAYRAASLGAIPVVGEPMPIAALRLQARTSGKYLPAIDVLTERSQTEWDAAGQPIVRDPSKLVHQRRWTRRHVDSSGTRGSWPSTARGDADGNGTRGSGFQSRRSVASPNAARGVCAVGPKRACDGGVTAVSGRSFRLGGMVVLRRTGAELRAASQRCALPDGVRSGTSARRRGTRRRRAFALERSVPARR